MTCDECRDNIAPYAAGELPPGESEEIARHIESCRECGRELDEERKLLRAVHNAAIPFREAVLRGESGGEMASAAREPAAPLPRLTRRRRMQAIIGGALAAIAGFLLLVVLPHHGNEIDGVSAWAVDHFPLIDQTHRLKGGPEDVRDWFKTHHGVEVIPPRDADYASLTGCKMIDMGDDPVPMLRFDGNVTSAVFILPARLAPVLRGDDVRGMRRGEYLIDVWSEGQCEYLRITRAKTGS